MTGEPFQACGKNASWSVNFDYFFRLIHREGMDKMSTQELQNANIERGMPAFGLSEDCLRAQLGEWVDLHLNYKVPPSLLLLSRTLYNVDTLAPTQKIASAISALPESAARSTSASIGMTLNSSFMWMV